MNTVTRDNGSTGMRQVCCSGEGIRFADSVRIIRIPEGRYLTFQADSGTTLCLNSSAADILTWAGDGLTPRQIGARIAGRCSGVTAERAARDTVALLGQLMRQRVIERGRRQGIGYQLREAPRLGDGPQELDVTLTGLCNSSCSYCSYATEMGRRRDLPTRAWLTFFREIGTLPVQRVCLSGGEVFLRRDFRELLDALLEQPVRYTVLTNGSRLDTHEVTWLCEGRRRTRLESIQVSLDGSCAEVHERSRGKGTFTPAVRALTLLVEAGLPVTCRVTVNRYNVHDLEPLARLLLETIGVPTISTNEACPQGAGLANRDTIGLLPAQRVAAMKTLTTLSRRYRGRIVAMAGPLAQARMFAAMRRQKARGGSGRDGDGRLSACGCVFRRLTVLHDGAVVPCALLSHLEMGKINRESLTRIWRGHPYLRMLRRRQNIPLRRVKGCENCAWAGYCNGGCPAIAWALTGDINRASPLDCYRRFLEETTHAHA